MFVPKQPPFEGAVCVRTVYNPVEGPMIRELLENVGIPSLIRTQESLDPLPVLAGFSVMGEEIYVPAEKAQEALDLIDAFTGETYETLDESEFPKSEEEEDIP